MKLTKEEQERFIKNINKYVTKMKCEICGENSWTIDDTLFEIREFHGGQTIIGAGFIKPFIVMSCSNCYNSKFFNPINLGVIKDIK